MTEAQINTLGFFKFKELSTATYYTYQQYTLIYDSNTTRVEVTYSAGTSTASYAFISNVDSISELETYLRKNGVIV